MSLQFQREAFEQLFDEDGLIIMARGLGLHKIFLNFLRLYCKEPSSPISEPALFSASEQPPSDKQEKRNQKLVIVLNIGAPEQQTIIEQLLSIGLPADSLPKRITSEYNANERTGFFNQGGVYFVHSPTFAMDLLYKRLSPQLIDGFLIHHCDNVSDSSPSAFVLRLYRQGNKTGFIKGFSEYPEAFGAGFAKVEKVMKSIFVKKLYLWPRFRDVVETSLQNHRPDVVELHQPMSPAMEKIQSSILEIMSACLQELRKNSAIDSADLTVDEGLFKEFDTILKAQLEPIWNSIGPKTKQLISDLSTLRKLLSYLLQYDCVSFYRYLETVRSKELGQYSDWLFMDAADIMFRVAKSRVFQVKRNKQEPSTKESPPKKIKVQSGSSDSAESAEEKESAPKEKEPDVVYQATLEENPKWQVLSEILKEIEKEESSGQTGRSGKVLIMVKDDRTVEQLQEFLEGGARPMLHKRFLRYIQLKAALQAQATETAQTTSVQSPRPPNSSGPKWKRGGKGGRGRGKNSFGGRGRPLSTSPTAASKLSELTGMLQALTKSDHTIEKIDLSLSEDAEVGENTVLAPDENELLSEVEDFDKYFGVLSAPHVVIHTMSARNSVLDDLKPKYVVIFDPDIAFFRQLEVYKAEQPGVPLRVYWLWYSESMEEKRYLIGLQKEDKAFKALIREKATMNVSMEQDGKTVIDLPQGTLSSSTRKADKFKSVNGMLRNKVIVDSREFRSALPGILHQNNMEIFPATLESGDYVITPEIGIERKSLSDLYGSFLSGRLYTQSGALCKNFKKAVLMIEFHEDKPFALPEDIRPEISHTSIISKIVLLTMHFPALRIFWCRSPFVTAKLFTAIKQKSEDPDTSKLTSREDEDEDKDQDSPEAVLRSLPGINSHNYRVVMEKVKNLQELCDMSLANLTVLIGSKNAETLFRFLREVPFS